MSSSPTRQWTSSTPGSIPELELADVHHRLRGFSSCHGRRLCCSGHERAGNGAGTSGLEQYEGARRALSADRSGRHYERAEGTEGLSRQPQCAVRHCIPRARDRRRTAGAGALSRRPPVNGWKTVPLARPGSGLPARHGFARS
nr:hypothetical protein [Sinorhizobium meliloti]